MGTNDLKGAVSLETYREQRIKEGTWPPSDKDQREYWERQWADVLDVRAVNLALAKRKRAEPKETLPPVDPKTGRPNFTKEEEAEFMDLFGEPDRPET